MNSKLRFSRTLKPHKVSDFPLIEDAGYALITSMDEQPNSLDPRLSLPASIFPSW
jgi:hypothetical protein